MSDAGKDTIYIDVDDEITSIIDKLQNSPKKIVALVLPKRAAMLQSIVNMKLLKKTAQTAKKNVVLITSEHHILPLAGAVGLHVAKTLQTKPFIPPKPDQADLTETITAEVSDEQIDTQMSVGELSGKPEAAAEEVINMDNGPDSDLVAASAAADIKDEGAVASSKNKFKIPNFEKFRLRLILGALLVLLIIAGWYWGFVIAPKAKITIKTDTSNLSSTVEFTAQTDTEILNLESKTLPTKYQDVKKTSTEKVPATGQKDIGEKSKGTMTVYNCSDNDTSVPAGTIFADSVTGLSFSSDAAVEVASSNFTSGGVCKKDHSANVAVTATQAGDKYNLSSGRSYTSNFATKISGTGSAMTGGTSNIVKIVSEADINAAKQKIADQQKSVSDELKTALQASGLIGLVETLTNETPVVTSSPNVGEQGNEVSVTVNTTFKMIGLKQDDIKQIVQEDINKQIDKTKQMTTSVDITNATFHVGSKISATQQKVTMQTQATVGPKLDQNEIKNTVKGRKQGDIQNIIGNRPGVKEVKIDYSPFWVYSTPKNIKKITVQIVPAH